MQWRKLATLTRRLLLAVGGLLALASVALAGRPLVTDDATIVDARSCQIEAWFQRARDGASESWLLPACKLGGNLELTLGGARLRDNGQAASAALFQAKSVLRQLEPGDWGLAVSLIDEFDPRDGLRGDLRINMPLTVALADQRWHVHADLGWLRERAGPQRVTRTLFQRLLLLRSLR